MTVKGHEFPSSPEQVQHTTGWLILFIAAAVSLGGDVNTVKNPAEAAITSIPTSTSTPEAQLTPTTSEQGISGNLGKFFPGIDRYEPIVIDPRVRKAFLERSIDVSGRNGAKETLRIRVSPSDGAQEVGNKVLANAGIDLDDNSKKPVKVEGMVVLGADYNTSNENYRAVDPKSGIVRGKWLAIVKKSTESRVKPEVVGYVRLTHVSIDEIQPEGHNHGGDQFAFNNVRSHRQLPPQVKNRMPFGGPRAA